MSVNGFTMTLLRQITCSFLNIKPDYCNYRKNLHLITGVLHTIFLSQDTKGDCHMMHTMLCQQSMALFSPQRWAMSSSACQWTTLRPIVISSLVLLCFLVLLYTYCNHDIKFPHFNFYKDESSHLCSVGRAQTEESNPNCSTELLFKPPRNGTQRIQATAADTEPDTIVLIWMWPFGNEYDLNCSAFNITGCHLTDNKSWQDTRPAHMFEHAHTVTHTLTHKSSRAAHPIKVRRSFQNWYLHDSMCWEKIYSAAFINKAAARMDTWGCEANSKTVSCICGWLAWSGS